MKQKIMVFVMFIAGCIAAELPSNVQREGHLAGEPTNVQVTGPEQSGTSPTLATISFGRTLR